MNKKRFTSLKDQYKPSEPCACDLCRSFCRRPGWWTVEEAEKAFDAGLSDRMMLEVSPEFTFGVLSPAFAGCEKKPAFQYYAGNGCCFLAEGFCTLYGSGFQPLECRVCHHAKPGLGKRCHADIEKDWNSARGQALVDKWAKKYDIVERYGIKK